MSMAPSKTERRKAAVLKSSHAGPVCSLGSSYGLDEMETERRESWEIEAAMGRKAPSNLKPSVLGGRGPHSTDKPSSATLAQPD